MRVHKPVLPLLAALSLVAVAACAPQNTATSFGPGSMGMAADVSYGTIVGARPVMVQGSGGNIGTVAGAVAGGVAGSFIGGDWRSNALAGIGGAILGGMAGNAIGNTVSQGQAVEFIVREDRGGDIAVVQTNELGLQPGDRVMISRGDRVRLARAAGGPVGVGAQTGFTQQPMGGSVK